MFLLLQCLLPFIEMSSWVDCSVLQYSLEESIRGRIKEKDVLKLGVMCFRLFWFYCPCTFLFCVLFTIHILYSYFPFFSLF